MSEAPAASVFTRHHRVEADGVDTEVHEAGGSAAPILFLHGNPDTHDVWAPVVERLAPNYRCIAPDLPGYGGSRIPDDFNFSLENQGAWVAAVVRDLGLEHFHLVVHDVGGPYGLAFASNHASRLRSLTILNTNFFPGFKWHFWARVWRTKGLGELAMAIANKPLFVREMRRGSPRIPRAYAEHAYEQYTRATRKQVLRWYRAMDPEAHSGWDQRLLTATANTPKAVLWGDLDPFLVKETADRYGVPARHFANAGHWLMQEEPDQVAQAIDELVAAHV